MAAALAVAEPAQPEPPLVAPVVVSPQVKPPPADATVNMPGSPDNAIGNFVAVWPASAYRTRQDGKATLSCRINVYGLAESCRVLSETPPGKGFGKAALQLRPTLTMPPDTGPDGRPVAATKTLAISFVAPQLDVDFRRMTEELRRIGGRQPQAPVGGSLDFINRGSLLPMRDVTMLDNPVWAEAASFEDVARAHPAPGVDGYGAAHCRVERRGAAAGALRECFSIKETPEGKGFGRAAVELAARFRVAPATLAHAPRGVAVWVDIPIRFPATAARTVEAPVWITGFDPLAAPKVFPPEAIARGLTSGRGVARCTVGADGSLSACAPDAAEPEGAGFAEAVAKLAGTMRMNLWSADAAPVSGGVVRVAMRLNLKGN